MKRLNVKLLAILLGSAVVVSGGLYLLWRWQVANNAEFLMAQAKEAENSGNFERALTHLGNYVRLRPKDEKGWTALALTAVRWTKSPQAEPKAFGTALNALERATQAHPENDEVRKELVNLSMDLAPYEPRLYSDAESHLSVLIPKVTGAEKAEFEVDLAKCHLHENRKQEAMRLLAEIVGYDDSSGQIDDTKAAAPNSVDAHFELARLLNDMGKAEAADRVIDKLTARNQQSYKAFLRRGQYLRDLRKERIGEAQADLKQARRLIPNDAEKAEKLTVGLSLARAARDLGEFITARQELDSLKAEFPDNENLYQELAELAIADTGAGRDGNQPEADSKVRLSEALAYVEEGLNHSPESAYLMWLKCSLLISLERPDDARAMLPKLRETRRLQQPLLDFINGQILFSERKWLDASRMIESSMSKLPDTDLRVRAGMILAQCYYSLHQLDKAKDACERVLAMNPKILQATLLRAEILKQQGESRHADVERAIVDVAQNMPADNPYLEMVVQSNQLQMALYKVMALPEEQRDWSEVNKFVDQLLPGLEESKQLILKAEIAGFQKRDAEAAQILQEAQSKFPQADATWIASAKVAGRTQGPQAALALLDRGTVAAGDTAGLRTAKASYLAAIEGEAAKEGLRALLSNMDGFKPDERKKIREAVGTVFFALQDFDAATEAWRAVQAEFPDDPTITLALFDLERERGSEEGMQRTLAEIERGYGANSTEWKLAKATLILRQIQSQTTDPSQINEARRLLEEVRDARPNWDRPYRFLADVDLLQGRINDSIRNLQDVIRLNPSDTKTAGRLMVTLAGIRRYKDAALLIPHLGSGPFRPQFHRLLSEIHDNNGNTQQALEEAAKSIPSEGAVAADYAWYGGMLARHDRNAEAETALRKACELEPTNPRHWLTLVEHLALTGQNSKLSATINEARTHVGEAHATLATGQALNLLAKSQLEKAQERATDPNQSAAAQQDEAKAKENLEKAGQFFVKAAELAPHDVMILRAVAAHYGNNRQTERMVESLDKIIAAANDIDEQDAEHLRWARQIKAQVLAATRDYQNFLQALDLLKQNTEMKAGPSSEDTRLRAMLLAQRDKEPENWRQALNYFELLKNHRGLFPSEQMILAQLYHNAGKDYYTRAQAEAVSALTALPNNVQFVKSFINMLLEEDEFDKAAPWIDKLRQMEPNSVQAALATARILHERKQSDRAKQLIRQVRNSIAADDKDSTILKLAEECTRLKYYDMAEELFREAAKDPKNQLFLAAYLGQVGQLDEAFEKFGQIMAAQKSNPKVIDAVTLYAMTSIYANRDKYSTHQLEMIEQWLKQGVNAAPDVAAFQIRLAELYDLMGNRDEVVRRYKELLARTDLSPEERGGAMNNLAYVYATRTNQPADAQGLIDDSIAILGPRFDLLDTRGMVKLAAGHPQEAVKDLELANLGRRDPNMLLHLAWAHFDANDLTAAKTNLSRAIDAGLDERRLAPVELEKLKEIKAKLGFQ